MYATIDIGGTHTRVGISTDLRTFINEPIIFDTPHNYSEGLNLITENIKKMSSISDLKAVSIGVAGILKNKNLIRSPNLPGWIEQKIASDLSTNLRVPVLIENDAALAGLGEAHFGSGEKEGLLSYITISTGIGGARIEDGQITKNSIGFEPGHQIIDVENEQTVEDIASGAAVQNKYHKEPKEVDKTIWPKLSRYMAIAVYNSTLHWSPDLIVLGGSMTNNEPGLYEMIVDHLEEISKKYYPIPEVRRSELKELNGLYGGLALIEQKL